VPTVKDGDCMVSLADSLGMQDYHTLYDDGVNATLKASRPNPNQLRIGDDVKDPPAKAKVHSKAVDQTWTFTIKVKKLPRLRLVLVDGEDKPLAGKAWKLTAPRVLTGMTKNDGLIEVPDLAPQQTAGALEVTWQTTKARKPAAVPKDPVIGKPTYPRPIKAGEFTDDPPTAPTAADDVIQFTLKIGSMPPFDADDGVRARLHNLGYPCVTGSDADATKRSVKAFQRGRLKQKTPSGAAADIRAAVRDRHDAL
jgi:hypothetical protein